MYRLHGHHDVLRATESVCLAVLHIAQAGWEHTQCYLHRMVVSMRRALNMIVDLLASHHMMGARRPHLRTQNEARRLDIRRHKKLLSGAEDDR